MTGVPWRALMLGLGAPVVVLALAAGLWDQARQAGDAAAAAEARLARALARPAPLPEADALALLVPGASLGLAGSALQAAVRGAVAGSGAQVVEVAMGAAEAEGPLTRLHLVLRLAGSEGQIVAALVALEGAVPLIAVDRLEMQGSGAEAVTATLSLSAWSGEVRP